MSIAVWIRNDTDKKYIEEFDCLYCQEEEHQSECPVCQGVGKLTKIGSQYFMNLTNSKFCDLWTGLGLPFDDGGGFLCGEITALKLSKAIQNCDDELNHSLPTIRGIAQRAYQMGEDVLWG